MYVSGINYPKQSKHWYGKLGDNIAYHGYQSFVSAKLLSKKHT